MIFEALDAAHGDCLMVHRTVLGDDGLPVPQIWLIDGGPTATYEKALAPRLRDLQKQGAKPLRIALLVVTHIDDDHIDGIARLTGALAKDPRQGGTPNVQFGELWFNGFVETFGAPAAGSGDVASLASNDAFSRAVDDPQATAFLQGVADGERLLDDLKRLRPNIAPPALNASFGADPHQKAIAPRSIRFAGDENAKLLILTPSEQRLAALKQKWQTATKSQAELQAILRGRIDDSVANLSSIVFLAEVDGTKLLLTGDGLAEDIIAGWNALKGNTTPYPVDLMKVPHHGSNANNSEALFRLFPAEHYVFCANGKNDNPDMATLQKLFAARDGAAFTVHLTSNENNQAIAEQVKFLKDKVTTQGGRVKLRFRPEPDLSICIEFKDTRLVERQNGNHRSR